MKIEDLCILLANYKCDRHRETLYLKLETYLGMIKALIHQMTLCFIEENICI